MTSLNVIDFGAKPWDNSFEDTAAVNAAIRAAGETDETVEVIFPRGTYILDSVESKEDRFVIAHKNINNVTLRGNGSMLYVKNPFAGVFIFRECSNITIEGFEIKYERATWTQGEIISTDLEKGTAVYESMEGYDLFSDSRYVKYREPFGAILDNENPRMLRADAPDHFRLVSAEPLGDRKYIFNLLDPDLVKKGILKAGDKVLYTNREMSGSSFALFGSKNMCIKDSIVHESGDCLVVGAYLEGDLIINGLQSRIDGKNYVVTNADGIHIQGLRGRAIIENCNIEGLLDDGVNLYQYPGIVTERISDTQIRVMHPQGNLPRVGDTVMIYNPQTQAEKMRMTVLGVSDVNDTKTQCIISTDADCGVINCGDAVPQADTFCIAESMAPGSIIRNNSFRLSRRYGLLLKSRDTRVEHNIFENLGADAVNFAANVTDLHKEGPYSENVVIYDNVINNVCYRNGRKQKNQWASGACIGIYKYNKNIRLKNNVFKNPPKYTVSYIGEEDGIHFES